MPGLGCGPGSSGRSRAPGEARTAIAGMIVGAGLVTALVGLDASSDRGWRRRAWRPPPSCRLGRSPTCAPKPHSSSRVRLERPTLAAETEVDLAAVGGRGRTASADRAAVGRGPDAGRLTDAMPASEGGGASDDRANDPDARFTCRRGPVVGQAPS